MKHAHETLGFLYYGRFIPLFSLESSLQELATALALEKRMEYEHVITKLLNVQKTAQTLFANAPVHKNFTEYCEVCNLFERDVDTLCYASQSNDSLLEEKGQIVLMIYPAKQEAAACSYSKIVSVNSDESSVGYGPYAVFR